MSDRALITGLPQALEAERIVLGAALNGDTDFSGIQQALSIEDFALEAHRRIFQRMEDIHRVGRPIDRVT